MLTQSPRIALRRSAFVSLQEESPSNKVHNSTGNKNFKCFILIDFKLLIDYFSGLRLLSASRLIASSRLPPSFSDKAKSSIFSVSSVVNV